MASNAGKYTGISRSDWPVFLVVLLAMAVYDTFLFAATAVHYTSSQTLEFTSVFANVIFLAMVLLLRLSNTSKAFKDKPLKSFIGMDGRRSKVTFADISSFLGEQSLGSFVASFCIVQGKKMLKAHLVASSAFATSLIFIVAICLVALSLVKFMWLFRKQHWFVSALAALIAIVVMLSFFKFGLLIGATTSV